MFIMVEDVIYFLPSIVIYSLLPIVYQGLLLGLNFSFMELRLKGRGVKLLLKGYLRLKKLKFLEMPRHS